ncbi:disease resistance protein RPV1-like [Nymphaea colorata]|nr:disease resistance protein RPV1-like [Nymphaea colorata]
MAATSSSEEGRGFEYDVFLSFRGEDTRKGFTGHLYYAMEERGIRTFMDDEKLDKGESIKQLLGCIEKSKIFVPIFSKRYAESRWCLMEVAKMVQCQRLIIPVFFDVKPTHVRNQSGPFEAAFESHENNKHLSKKTLQAWRDALRTVGEISGYVLETDTDGHEAKLNQVIIRRILSELNKAFFYVAKHPVGMDDSIKEMLSLLDIEKNDVRMIGINGIGGIGKTTLAKAVFNRISTSFQFVSFISNVREVSNQVGGLVSLQKQLILDVTKDSDPRIDDESQACSRIKELICKKSVLLVLDDVDDRKQLNALADSEEWFGPKSRIIVTTRYDHVLKERRMSKQEIYQMKELNKKESLELFSYHAFGEKKPTEKYQKLSEKVVSTTNGIPLMLEVFGALFFGIDCAEEWEGLLEELNKNQDKDVHERLRISYDGLSEKEKQVYLDIVCFFSGKDKDEAFYVWKDCNFSPYTSVQTLLRRSLIKISSDKQVFELHDQILDMGKEIIRRECLLKPSKRSRLWDSLSIPEGKAPEDPCSWRAVAASHIATSTLVDFKFAASLLLGDVQTFSISNEHDPPQGAENIQVIYFNYLTRWEKFSTRDFVLMCNLRLLYLNHISFHEKDFTHLPNKLKWLEWHWCPLKSLSFNEFNLMELVVLKLCHGDFRQVLTKHNLQIVNKKLDSLKVLDLSYCLYIITTPDFASLPNLVKLVLDGCDSLSEVDRSIGNLKELVTLSMKGCGSLMELPDSICKLSSLENLSLDHCRNISTLPKLLGNLMSLRKLSLVWCTLLKELPESIGKMTSLEELILEDSWMLKKIPDSIGTLNKLQHLSVKGCTSLEEVPDSIGGLVSLEILILDYCTNIKVLPSSIGNLKNLYKLSLNYCPSLEELSCSIGKLQSLKELLLDGCQIRKVPYSVGSLKKLYRLSLAHCLSLEEVPDSIGELESLEELILTFGKNDAMPDWIGNLRALDILILDGSASLRRLSDSIGELTNLRLLSLEESRSLEQLPSSIGSLCRLEQLILNGCQKLQSIPLLPSTLVALEANGCVALETVCDVSDLLVLKELHLDECTRLVEIAGLENLKSLSVLRLWGCKHLSNHLMVRLFMATYEHLEKLVLSGSQTHDGHLLFGLPRGPAGNPLLIEGFSVSIDGNSGTTMQIEVMSSSETVFKIEWDEESISHDEIDGGTYTILFKMEDEIQTHLEGGHRMVKVSTTASGDSLTWGGAIFSI